MRHSNMRASSSRLATPSGHPYLPGPMAKPLPQPFDKQKVVAENRRARFDYFVEDRFEAGIQLAGTEVKSLRHGEGSIAESYAALEGE